MKKTDHCLPLALKYAISSPDLLLDSPSATGSTFRAHMLPTMASRVLQLSTPPSPLQQQQTTSLVDLDLPVPRSLDAITPQTIALVPGTQASRSRAKAQTPEPSRATRQRSWLWRFAGLLFALCVALSLLVSVSTLHERLDAVTARLETLSFALEPPQGMWQPPLEPNDDEAQQWNKGAAGNGATHTASPVAPPTRHAGPTPSPPSSLSVLRVVSTPMALLALLLRPFGRLFGMS